jgi:hypothetical protein
MTAREVPWVYSWNQNHWKKGPRPLWSLDWDNVNPDTVTAALWLTAPSPGLGGGV